VKRLLERLKSSWPGRLAAAYGQSKAGNYAAGLAFNAFMTMFPLILGLLSIVWLVVHDPSTEERLQNLVTGIFPPDAHDQLVQALKGVKRNSGLFGLISIVGLIWGGTSFFTSLEFALTQIFGTRQRDALRQRVMGLLMMLLFLAALLLTAGANAAAGSSLAGGQVAGFIVGALVLVALLTAIYRFVPNRSFRLAEIWPGALFAGVLIEVFSLIFPIYAGIAHGFNTYGQQFALFFLLATWLYFLSQLLLLGAVLNRMRLGPPREEGMVAQPGDHGETPPPPAQAIDEQRQEAGLEPAAEGSAPRAARSGGSPSAGDGRQRSRPVAAGKARPEPSATPPKRRNGVVRQALFAVLAAAIGILALLRHPKAPTRASR
jgi:membrane protein